jgi:hypothetical protein
LREVWGARSHTLGVIARLDRAIQYAEAVVVERTGRGVLEAPVKPGHDTDEADTLRKNNGTRHASRNDTRAQEFLHHSR